MKKLQGCVIISYIIENQKIDNFYAYIVVHPGGLLKATLFPLMGIVPEKTKKNICIFISRI